MGVWSAAASGSYGGGAALLGLVEYGCFLHIVYYILQKAFDCGVDGKKGRKKG